MININRTNKHKYFKEELNKDLIIKDLAKFIYDNSNKHISLNCYKSVIDIILKKDILSYSLDIKEYEVYKEEKLINSIYMSGAYSGLSVISEESTLEKIGLYLTYLPGMQNMIDKIFV